MAGRGRGPADAPGRIHRDTQKGETVIVQNGAQKERKRHVSGPRAGTSQVGDL